MIKKSLIYIFSMFTLCLSLGSCDNKKEEPDGKWEAMKWQMENLKGEVNFEKASNALMNITVSGEGSFDLKCLNYPFFWIAGANYPKNWDNIKEYDYEWLSITISGDTAHCEFTNVPEEFHNELYITFTAGDIFFTVSFNREEDFGASGKWAPIKWSVENIEGDVKVEELKYYINFIVEGDCSFDLVCTNYNEIWFLPGLYTPWPMEDFYNVDAHWCHLSINGNTISCKLDAWDGIYSPGIDFEVTAGEISDQLYLYQKSVITHP